MTSTHNELNTVSNKKIFLEKLLKNSEKFFFWVLILPFLD
jgi:hypothetical protein